MKKILFYAFIVFIVGSILYEPAKHFINVVDLILHNLFISSIIPYSWLITRLLLGVICVISMVFVLALIGHGLILDSIAFLVGIPILFAMYWILLHALGFLHYREFNFDLRIWFFYWVISGGVTAVIFAKYGRIISGKITKFIDSYTHRPLETLSSTEEIFLEHDKLKLKSYNPLDYYDFKNRKVFLSLNVEREPIYVDYDSFIKKSHGNSTGKSQQGKNVAIQNVAVQLLHYDEFVVMCDAKDGGDDVMAPILYKYANEYGKNYNYIELSLTAPPQINILQIKDADFLKKILMQLAKLEETDDQAVGYHIQQDDAIAQKIALWIVAQQDEITIYEIVTQHFDLFFDPKKKEQTSLQTALIKLSYKPCINAKNGARYEDLIRGAGCLYIQAKTKDDNVILSVLISSLRFVRSQRQIPTITTVIADEFMKYASQDFIDIFTEGAGKGFKLITAYQTSALLEIKNIGKTSEQMLSVIMGNNSYEYIYGTRDPLVLDVFEEHYAGTKIVHEETKDAETGLFFTDQSTGKKKLKKALHARYPKDLLTKLRTGEHFLYVAGELLQLCYNGYLPLLKNGVFDKNSTEFLELVQNSRSTTLNKKQRGITPAFIEPVCDSGSAVDANVPEEVKDAQTPPKHTHNPFA